ncbi:MAG: PGPGW domain-containing protein [Planctomycetota bacterium]
MTDLLLWYRDNQPLVWTVVGVASAVTFVGSLILIPWVIARLPADYFLSKRPAEGSWRARHPVVRWVLRGAKNLLGCVFLAAGLAMLVLPGQGLLTVLIGVALLDFPGKRRLEIRLLRRPLITRSIAWIRRRAGKPPFQWPSEVDDGTGDSAGRAHG